MASITIKNLPANRELDRNAMSAIKGGGAPWVFGWITPYVEQKPTGFGGTINFFQTNNFFNADQMNNQFQVIDVNAAASTANIEIKANQLAGNMKLG